MLVAAKPTGSKRNPSIGPGVVDTLCQRLDAAWGQTLNISVAEMGELLLVLFPEHFGDGPDMGQTARLLFSARKPFSPGRARGRLTARERREQQE